MTKELRSDLTQELRTDFNKKLPTDLAQKLRSDLTQGLRSDLTQELLSDLAQELHADSIQKITCWLNSRITPWLNSRITIWINSTITAQVNTETGLVPIVLRELDVYAELPLTSFLPHQQLLFVRLHLNHISLFKLNPRLHSVALLAGVRKCLAIGLQKETPMANLVGFINSISTVLQIESVPFNHFPQPQTKTDWTTPFFYSTPQEAPLLEHRAIHQCKHILIPILTDDSHVVRIKLNVWTGKIKMNYFFFFCENLYNLFCFLTTAISSCSFLHLSSSISLTQSSSSLLIPSSSICLARSSSSFFLLSSSIYFSWSSSSFLFLPSISSLRDFRSYVSDSKIVFLSLILVVCSLDWFLIVKSRSFWILLSCSSEVIPI